jgi:hypothetical protein
MVQNTTRGDENSALKRLPLGSGGGGATTTTTTPRARNARLKRRE